MAVFKRLTKEQITRDCDHYALLTVQIYVGDAHCECKLVVRNWWSEGVLDLADFVHQFTP